MKFELQNQKAEKIGEIDLPDNIFGAKWNPTLVHQVLTMLQTSRRKPLAHAKGRGEVRGGGKKPWKQKGTGRARHGSIRSPLWKGGGVTFGPTKERVFENKINKKMKKAALISALSKKFSDKEISFIDQVKLSESKTKQAAAIWKMFFSERKNGGLIILPSSDTALIRATRNLDFAKVITAGSLGLEDVLRYKKIVFLKDAVLAFQERNKVENK